MVIWIREERGDEYSFCHLVDCKYFNIFQWYISCASHLSISFKKKRNNVIFIVLLPLAETYLGKDINLLTVDRFDDLIGNKWLFVT